MAAGAGETPITPPPEIHSIDSVLDQFQVLDQALIDTASLIYLSKINLLSTCSQTMRLLTIPEVAAEFGSPRELKVVEIIESKNKIKDPADTDQRLLRAADFLRLPVISEDKKVLMGAKRLGLPFFNTLMIMNFLLFKKAVDDKTYQTALEILKKKAYYNAFVFDYGNRVYSLLINKP